MAGIEQRLGEETACPLTQGVLLRNMSTWRIGGRTEMLAKARSMEEAARVFAVCGQEKVPVTLVGGGSNLLFDDKGVNGVVLVLCPDAAPVSIEGQRVLAGGGADVGRVARMAARAGLSGLEHASNIPGTLGGLVVMNGGSNRRSIGENVVRVTAMDRLGKLHTFDREACNFAYRTSRFQDGNLLVAEVELELEPGDTQAIVQAIVDDLAVREGKFPLNKPSCGSVFKSSPGLYEAFGPPGMVIDRLGLKGMREGEVQVSPVHANFFVNLGKASSEQVMALVDRVRQKVLGETGYAMECEVRHVSPDGDIAPLHLRLG